MLFEVTVIISFERWTSYTIHYSRRITKMSQLLSNLPTGAKVKFGKFQVNSETAQPIVWTVVAKNHQCTPAYPTNAITLHAAEILELFGDRSAL